MSELQGPQKLGPLTPLVGDWEGNVGVDVSYRHVDDETTTTGYFEKFSFRPIPIQQNGDQLLEGLKYSNTAWRHGEEAMDPFHDEIGYMLWDNANGQIMRAVVFGRGIAILAGGDAGPRDKELRFKATPGDPNYGILQNKHLSQKGELISFDGVFTFHDDGSLSYDQTLVLDIEDLGGRINHTDRNTFQRVKRISQRAEDN
jgi:hypothetical protein